MIAFDVLKESIRIINKNNKLITLMLQKQLAAGKDSEGKDVTLFGKDYYSDRTIFDKEHGRYDALGKVTDRITNYQTGHFYASMKTVAQGHIFKTYSEVWYFQEILKRSGEVIMKLNKENRETFVREILIPQLRLRFKAMQNGV